MGGDEKNLWLNDTPSKGDKDPTGLSGGGTDGINVRPDALTRFSNQALDESKTLAENLKDGVAPLLTASMGIGGPFHEAAFFAGMHQKGIEQLGMFTRDAATGTDMLGKGAQAIGSHYVDGDATSAATLKDVEQAFNPAKGEGWKPQATGGGPTGQAGNSSLPIEQQKAVDELREQAKQAREDNAYDATGRSEDQEIALGDKATYTVPAAGTNDMESVDMQKDMPGG